MENGSKIAERKQSKKVLPRNGKSENGFAWLVKTRKWTSEKGKTAAPLYMGTGAGLLLMEYLTRKRDTKCGEREEKVTRKRKGEREQRSKLSCADRHRSELEPGVRHVR
eukprot:2510459-Pleurochrysis_carterae.AAC.1